MDGCGCGKQAVNDGKGVRYVQPAPFLRYGLIDRQDAVSMRLDQFAQPSLERRGGDPIPTPDALDPFPDLPRREDAQTEIALGKST